jgi:hypothetical protein
MMSVRPLAFVIAAAAMLAALPATSAQACDNDRYPCPIVAQPETPDTAARAAPRKKASRAARQEEKARAKIQRNASDTAAPSKAAAPPQQAQTAESLPQKVADPAPALTLDNQVDRNDNSVAATAAGSVVLPTTESAGPQATAGDAAAAPAAPVNSVRVVDPNELNELDLAAAAAPPAQSSWLGSLLMTLGAALAAASAVRAFFV